MSLHLPQLFEAGNATSLGAIRVLFFLWLLVDVRWTRVRMLAEVQALAPGIWTPVSFYRLLPPALLRALSRRIDWLVWAWYASVLLAATGMLFPLGPLAVAALTLVLQGYDQQFGFVHHSFCAVPFISLILGCAPVDAFALWPMGEIVGAEAGFHWPIAIGQVLVACIWFSAGLAKLRYTGWRWGWSDQLRVIVQTHLLDYRLEAPRNPCVALWLCRHPSVCRLLGTGSLLLELLFPLTLVSSSATLLIVPASIALVIGIRITLGQPVFVSVALLSVLFWFPLSSLLASAGVLPAVGGVVTLLLALYALPIWRSATNAAREPRPVVAS